MRKRICLLLICVLFLSSCGNNTNEIANKKENTVISTNNYKENYKSYKDVDVVVDSGVSSLRYYCEAYFCLQDFYSSLYKIDEYLENMEEFDISMYLNQMYKNYNIACNMKVPEKYSSSHKMFIEALDKYIIGTEEIIKAYTTYNYDNYKIASTYLQEALVILDSYSATIEGDFEYIYTLIDGVIKNEYYFSIISFYSDSEDFTDEENNFLFTSERIFCNLSNLRESLFNNAMNGDSLTSSKKELENIKSTLNNISIKDEDLIRYRTDILNVYDIYLENIFIVAEEISSSKPNEEVILNAGNVLADLNYDIYIAYQGISDFYASYGIDIGFEEMLAQMNTIINNNLN